MPARFSVWACLDIPVDVIEPCGFVLDDRRLKQWRWTTGARPISSHSSWDAWRSARAGTRTILLTTQGDVGYTDFLFDADDVLLLGRESAGVRQKYTIPRTRD